jgi:hypothetical protein
MENYARTVANLSAALTGNSKLFFRKLSRHRLDNLSREPALRAAFGELLIANYQLPGETYMNYKTCTHTYDSGRACKSAAATGREFCGYHLHYRGRQMRMAQHRFRHQRFDIILPPLDSLCSIHSALSQVAEALATDMIDPRRAQGLLKALRFAKENLKDGLKDDNAHWHDTPYHSEDATAYDNFEAEYGLPEGLDLSTPPEVAFPPPASEVVNARVGCPTPAGFAGVGTFDGGARFPIPPSFDRAPLLPEIPPPVVRDYNAEAEAAMYETTPEDIELTELYNTQGYKAMERRGREHLRNQDRRRERKLFRANYARYAAEAKLKNIQRAAEQLLKQQAAEKAAAQKDAAQEAQPDLSEKKPPASVVPETAPATEQEAKSIA